MSNRSIDQGFIDFVRSLVTRIQRLESQNNGVRRNDIRLGNIVVTTDNEYMRVGLQDIKTKERVFLGNPPDAVFSYSGPVESGSTSPPHAVPWVTVARELVITTLPANVGTEDTTFVVYFNDGTIGVTITLPAGVSMQLKGLNIPMGKNQRIWVECTDTNGSDTPPTDVSVLVRFGVSALVDVTTSDV